MKISEGLLRKYISNNQLLRIYNEGVVEIYLEHNYTDEELKKYIDYAMKKSQQIREIEEKLLEEINNVSRETNKGEN